MPLTEKSHNDPLQEYTATVRGLHSKLARINANHKDIAASLGRTAAALRSLAEINKPNTLSVSRRLSSERENLALSKSPSLTRTSLRQPAE